ncbi:MAG: T9SS type A sorting domain-containing protein [Ignavibacteriae bacterium]|nr:T9SS type A sorting domain-containing protein [Ignavibacteriota bacterium]
MKKVIYALAIVLIVHYTFNIEKCMSQWVNTNCPTNLNNIISSSAYGTNIFVGTYDMGVFSSTNNGANWSTAGLTTVVGVNSLVVSGSNIFAGTNEGVFLSTNNGTNWTAVNNGLTNPEVKSLVVSGSKILAGTWASDGLTNHNLYTFAVSGTNIFAGTAGGVCLSTDNGFSWTEVNNGLTDLSILSLLVTGSNTFAGTHAGIFLSTNNGANWNSVLTNSSFVWSFAISDTNIFAGTADGILMTTNNGQNWIQKNQGFTVNIPTVYTLLISNNYIYAGTDGQSVWRRSLSEIIGIQNISAETPSAYSLGQNYPNPFNPVTRIRYELPRAVVVRLAVYDVMGREVEMLVNERQTAGSYEAVWDGTRFASGVYFYRLTAEEYGETKRMLLVK